jgi:hypothetical protein
MPYIVNGQPLTEERVRAEEVRIRHEPGLAAIPDETERARRLREAAEFAAMDTLLIEQMAARDPYPVPPAVMDRELRMQKALGRRTYSRRPPHVQHLARPIPRPRLG